MSNVKEYEKTALTDEQADMVEGAGFLDSVADALESVGGWIKDIFTGDDDDKEEPVPEVMPGFNVY